MPDNVEQFEPYERTDRLVELLLRGERPEPLSNVSQQEADILRIAGVLNSAGAAPQPRPEFMQALARELEAVPESGPRRLWSRFTRRGLLRGIAGAAGLLVAGAAADRSVTSLGHPRVGAGWVPVARAAELAPGSAVRFLAAEREGYVFNVDGVVSALSALCTHLPCVLQWTARDREFICPCHQAEFTTDGQHRPTPSYDRQLAPLAAFAVKQIGPLIYVFAGEPSDGAPIDNEDEEYQRP
jgi:cytochrome b6-f complex iron-sulfur subunit